MNRSLDSWLAHIEGLHPAKIELGLERVRAVADRLGLALPCVVITVAGTNGKGSSCAMLEAILLESGYRVGTYTSPHLVHFAERARVNGKPAEADELARRFEAVEAARNGTPLTYFEFSTLAILRLFQESGLDAAILEVGLGGRLDAVNLVDADCAIVTSIDIDHADWLGDTREQIGLEKAHIFRPGRPAICSDPVPPQSLIDHAASLGADLWLFGLDFNYSGDRQQWSWAGRGRRRSALAYPALRGANQLLNASGVLAALEALRDRLPVTQQAVRQGFATVELPGRFQVLPGQPAVVLDVAHNPHAAAHLATNLDNMGFFPRTLAVFGIMADKDIDAVIRPLKDRVDHWFVARLPGERAAAPEAIAARLRAAGVADRGEDNGKGSSAKSGVASGAVGSAGTAGSGAGSTAGGSAGSNAAPPISLHESPSEALAAAQNKAGPGDRIIVFGSFLTVADVLSSGAADKRSSMHGQAQR